VFVVEFYIKLKLILRIIIDHFVIKSDNLGGFFNFKTILIISCNHDNTSCLEFSKARVSACMYFLVIIIKYLFIILIKKTAQSITKFGWYKSVISV
jgi:hypothetical protein